MEGREDDRRRRRQETETTGDGDGEGGERFSDHCHHQDHGLPSPIGEAGGDEESH